MRKRLTFAAFFFGLLPGSSQVRAQQVVDRIVARVETDIILQSDVRQLSRYQAFLDGNRRATRKSSTA